MRKKIVAGNWKMNLSFSEAKALVSNLISREEEQDCEVVICPPSIYLSQLSQEVRNSKLKIGAQNCYFAQSGAYTGEISPEMLKSIEIDYCIIGHSERRTLFGETDSFVAKKAKSLLDYNRIPIICVGENLEERELNQHERIVKNQLTIALSKLSSSQTEKVIVAYEPVWAIGTGKTASPEQVQEMHAFIRKSLSSISNQSSAEKIPILYGGSCKPNNADAIFALPDVDGGLIGGASLQGEDFREIIKANR